MSVRSSRAWDGSSVCFITRTRRPPRRATSCCGANGPKRLPNDQLDDLLALDPSAPHSDSIRRARHAVIGEPLFALRADEILEKAARLPAGERYALLADWVLPSPDHPVFRLEGNFSPSFPPPGLSTTNSRVRKPLLASVAPSESRAAASLRAPAIELVDTANALGKLDELAKRIDAIKLDTDSEPRANERGKLALLGLIQIVRGDDAAAAKALDTIKTLHRPDAGSINRSGRGGPNWSLIARAIERPGLRTPALSLLEDADRPVREEVGQAGPSSATAGLWENHLYHLRAGRRC